MTKVAITGGIASGKSMCLSYLLMLGYTVYSADSIAHDILEREAKEKVVNFFGTFILRDDGKINRRALASIVFNDRDAMAYLESIIHPLVRKKITDLASNSGDDIIFFEVPLLFESHMEDLFDVTINIYTSKENQIKRVMARDDVSEEDAIKRISSQMDTYEKNKLATYVIASENVEELHLQIDEVLRRIKENEI